MFIIQNKPTNEINILIEKNNHAANQIKNIIEDNFSNLHRALMKINMLYGQVFEIITPVINKWQTLNDEYTKKMIEDMNVNGMSLSEATENNKELFEKITNEYRYPKKFTLFIPELIEFERFIFSLYKNINEKNMYERTIQAINGLERIIDSLLNDIENHELFSHQDTQKLVNEIRGVNDIVKREILKINNNENLENLSYNFRKLEDINNNLHLLQSEKFTIKLNYINRLIIELNKNPLSYALEDMLITEIRILEGISEIINNPRYSQSDNKTDLITALKNEFDRNKNVNSKKFKEIINTLNDAYPVDIIKVNSQHENNISSIEQLSNAYSGMESKPTNSVEPTANFGYRVKTPLLSSHLL